MIKKPKRQLKVKSIFNEDGTNPQIVNTQPEAITPEVIEQPAKIEQPQQCVKQPVKHIPIPPVQQPVQIVPIPQQLHHQQSPKQLIEPKTIAPVAVQKVQKFESIPKSEPQVQVQPQPVDSKKSKIQQLKQKYLKKNLNVSKEITITEPIRGVIQQKKENVVQQQKKQIKNNSISPKLITPEVIVRVQQKQQVQSKDNNIIQSDTTEQYQTNFAPIIQQKLKAKTPPPPIIKRPAPPVRDPFELKGTYPQHHKTESIPLVSNPIDTTNELQNTHHVKQFEQPHHHTHEPTPDSFHPQLIQPYQNTNYSLNYSNLVRNPQNFIEQLQQNHRIPQLVYQLSLERFFNQASSVHEIEVSTNHPEFNSWLSRLFVNTLLKSQVIQQNNESLADEILNQFFLPLGDNFSPAFIVVLSKLNQQYYYKYQQYLLSSPQYYIDIIATYQSYISKSKISEFLLFIQGKLNQNLENICQILLTMFLTSSETINEYSLNLFINRCHFEEAALLLLVLGRLKQKFVRQNIELANIVIRRLEENKQIEVGLELVKQLNEQLGTSAYALLKETRDRLIKGYSTQTPQEQTDTINQVKNVASNLFGFFSNAMDKIINKQPEVQASKPEKQPEVKQNIYYDHDKKRYVLNGEIPDDHEEEAPAQAQKQVAPPPPQVRGVPPPPAVPIPSNVGLNKRQNRMPVNRYV